MKELISCQVSYLSAVLNRCWDQEEAIATTAMSSGRWEEYNKLMPTELWFFFFPENVRSALKGALQWLHRGCENECEGEIKPIRNELQKVTHIKVTQEKYDTGFRKDYWNIWCFMMLFSTELVFWCGLCCSYSKEKCCSSQTWQAIINFFIAIGDLF